MNSLFEVIVDSLVRIIEHNGSPNPIFSEPGISNTDRDNVQTCSSINRAFLSALCGNQRPGVTPPHWGAIWVPVPDEHRADLERGCHRVVKVLGTLGVGARQISSKAVAAYTLSLGALWVREGEPANCEDDGHDHGHHDHDH